MRAIRLIGTFIGLSVQQELAYRSNFVVSLFYALLNVGTGILALTVIFGQVDQVNGWSFAATLALLGVYLTLQALRALFIGPSLDALAGMGGAVWQGTFDFVLLRPIHTQFFVSVQKWQPLALFDLLLGLGVLASAINQLGQRLAPLQIVTFVITLCVSLTILYSLLLLLTSLIFLGPPFFYTWLFDAMLQLARYPVGLYPGWIRLLLTWIVPIGLMTTAPAQAINGTLDWPLFGGGLLLAVVLFVGASGLFQLSLRRYTSASS